MESLSSSEKIKKLRKKLNMNQIDLEPCGVSRNFISMVECGKKKLSMKTAKRMVPIFEKKAEQLGVNIDIDAEYLINGPNEDLEREYINKINKSTNESDIDEVMSICREKNFKKGICMGHVRKGDLLFNKGEYVQAFKIYYKTLELNKDFKLDKTAFIYNKLGKCRIKLIDYDGAILLFEKAQEYSIILEDDVTMKNSLYNLALSYSNIEKSSKSIEYINEYINLISKEKEFNNYIAANIIKANCFMDKKEYDKEIDLYTNLINEIEDKENIMIGYVYDNLGLMYFKLKDMKNALKNFEKSEEIRRLHKDKNLSHTLIYKSKVYIDEKRFYKAEKVLKEGIEIAKENYDKEYIIKGYSKFEEIYIKNDNTRKLEELYEKMLQMYDRKSNNKEVLEIYIKLSIINLNKRNFEKAKELLYNSIK